MNPNNKERVKKSIIQALRKTGYNAFLKSRSRCPIITGALKSSGRDKILDDGYMFEYTRDYASFVNRGVKPGMRHINGYYRKDGAYVKSHSFWHPGQRAQHFVDEPVKEEFQGQGFANNLDATLRMNFKGVKRQ